MKYAMGCIASMCERSLAATEDGVTWPEMYALLSSAAVQYLPVPSGFGVSKAFDIPARHQKHVGRHWVSVIM